MRNLETIKEAIEKAMTMEENLKITNELLLDIREMLLKMPAAVPTSVAAADVKLVKEKDESEFIANLPLTTRSKNILINGGVIRLNQLKGVSQSDILKARNSGQVTLKEILTVAKENGIDIPQYDS